MKDLTVLVAKVKKVDSPEGPKVAHHAIETEMGAHENMMNADIDGFEPLMQKMKDTSRPMTGFLSKLGPQICSSKSPSINI